MCARMRVCVCMCVRAPAHLAAYCQADSLLGFSLGRLFGHDLDGALLCGKQGPLHLASACALKPELKEGKKEKEKETTWSGTHSTRGSVAFSSELPTF